MGDAINWEALLAQVPMGEDLYFISDDKDFCSPLDDEKFNAFLLHEWKQNKESQLIFHKRLSGFFKDRFPQIRLAAELEKDLQIKNLARSGSFSRTHSLIAQLSRHSDFSDAQLNDIVDAVLANGQVYRIADDKDVSEFLCKLTNGRETKIDPSKLERLYQYMSLQLNPAGDRQSDDDDDSDILF